MKLFYYIVLFTYIVATSFAADAPPTLTAGPVSCSYKDKDLNDSYNSNSDVRINCNGNSCSVTGSGASASNGKVTISAAGTYIVQGTLNGQVLIDVTKEDFIHLVLNSATIKSSNGPAIYATAASKVVITLAGSNSVSDSSNYTVDAEGEPDACIFINSDLTINGSGSINVGANYSDAIRCKKDLKIVSGNITIPGARQRGIKARNSICILDPVIDITSENTAIKVTKDDDPEKGFVVIDGGKINISTNKDAIHAETHMTIRGGYIDVKKCQEGIEGQMVDIIGGEIHVYATNDAINAAIIKTDKNRSDMADFGAGNDGSVYINIVGGKVYVDAEGKEIDGIDANGVLYIGGNAEVYSTVYKGTIFGFYAALDSDGANSICSGATVVALGTSGGNGSFFKRQWNGGNNGQWGGQQGGQPGGQWNGQQQGGQPGGQWNGQQQGGQPGGQWNGQQGGNNGQWGGQGGWNMGGGGGGFSFGGFSQESGKVYQPYILTSLPSQNQNAKLTISDRSGNVIITYQPKNPYAAILATSPKMVAGQTYTITAGSSTTTVTASSPEQGNVNPPSIKSPSEDKNVPVSNSQNNNNNNNNTNNNKKSNCSQSIKNMGYKCCSASCTVVYTDDDGDWGVENGDWCGCGGGSSAASASCPSAITSQGFPCCSQNNCVVYYNDESGRWGVENNDWCGTPNSC